jgi:hypothetical protein
MEDCKNLFGPYGDLLFMGDVLPEPLRTLWRLLRTAARHYIFIGNPEETFTTRARQDARRALRQFAIMIERDDRLPRSLLSYTLHMMLCRWAVWCALLLALARGHGWMGVATQQR